MKWSQAVLIALLSAPIAWAQGANGLLPESIVQAHLLPGETADVQLKSAIAALAGKGGVVEARGLSGTQMIAHTIVIPANTTVMLHPNVVYTCTVASAPCWALTGNGSRLLGSHAGSNDVESGSQTGTVLRMGSGITSTTDMIVVNPSPAHNVAGVELGGFTIDFANASSTTGRHGLAVYALNRSWIHDILILNPGSDGFHAETAPNLHSYEVTMDRVFVRSARRDGFRWDASTNPKNLDFDKWTLNTLNYTGFNLGTQLPGKDCPAPSGRLGVNGVNLTSGIAGQSVDDFDFNNLFVAAVDCGGNGVLLKTSNALGYIIRISITGEIEDDVGKNNGLALNATGILTAGVSNIQQLALDCYCGSGNWTGGLASPFNPTNISSSTVTSYRYGFDGASLVRTDGVSIVPGSLPSSSTYSPTGGLVTFQGPSSDFFWYTDTSNVLHIARTDPGISSPADYFLLDQVNKTFKPATNNAGSLGTPTNRWASVNAAQVQLGNSYTFRSLPSAPNGTIVYCSDCNATCTAGSSTGRTCFRESGIWTH